MNSRQRGVLTRTIIGLAIFAYVAYLAWKQLPRFDFMVIITFFAVYFSWTIISETFVYQDPDVFVIEDDDRRSYVYLQLTYMLGLFYAALDFVEYHLTREYSLEPWVFYIGIFVFLVSAVIRWWGFKAIGKFFNPRVAVYEGHELVTYGAYASIRHPLYLGSLLSFISIPLIFNSWGAMLLMIFATVPALIYRIEIEEEFMRKHFGKEYEEYMKHTKKLIPGIW